MISEEEYEGMLMLAKSDDGMKNLLEQCMSYYILKGSPIDKQARYLREQMVARDDFHRIMNTKYGL